MPMLASLEIPTQLALFSGLLFIVIGSPLVYRVVDYLVSVITRRSGYIASADGAPTRAGTVVHGLVVAILTWLYVSAL
jgi:hypothetical protein